MIRGVLCNLLTSLSLITCIHTDRQVLAMYSEFIGIHMIACHHVLQLHTCPYTVVNLLACCPNTDRTADHAELAAGISDGKPWTTHIAAEL
jgi:hypothetical protein